MPFVILYVQYASSKTYGFEKEGIMESMSMKQLLIAWKMFILIVSFFVFGWKGIDQVGKTNLRVIILGSLFLKRS